MSDRAHLQLARRKTRDQSIALLIAGVQPYRCLARATRWVGGNGTRFIWWFWAPILALPVSFMMMMVAGNVSANAEEGEPSFLVANGLMILALALPSLVFLLQAHKAMRELETAVVMSREASPGADFDPEMMAERIRLAAAYQAAQGQPGF